MVHCFRNNGYNLVLDVDSGAVHSMDEVSYRVVEEIKKLKEDGASAPSLCDAKKTECNTPCDTPSWLCDSTKNELVRRLSGEFSEDQILEAWSEVRELTLDGALFTEEDYEPYLKDPEARISVVKALCLHVAHACNLACRYCFAGEGEYHGERALMSYETGAVALDFLIKSSGTRTNLEVDFFGGEPTMNWDVVKRLVAYGRSREKESGKRFRFTVTTNGLLLDEEKMEFVNAEMDNIVMSLDGRKEINDMMRPTRNGKGSFDIIVPKFLKMARMRGKRDYYVRGTYTHFNRDFSKDVLALADLGFEQISVEPVVTDPKEPYALTEEDIPFLCAEYDKLAAEMAERKNTGRDFNFFHFMIDLDGGPCVVKRMTGCGSGTEYLAVTPQGDLYPCHQFVGNGDFAMGNVWDGISAESVEMRRAFSSCNVFSKPECRECFAKFFCSGGCAANAYNSKGEINAVYEIGCALERKRVECAIMLKAAEAAAE